ncbi:calcium/calmodulin-regulated receptor-like kinase 1 isoform X3 [Musa acuminata AAA Group]|uniref:calcium/calmodulin-regulated receptor-like kinase 1 isoform X3 n=1 Tax=Musa acuminata AAA Group TaxID=214697 RepID=UPI0031D91786
MWKMEERSGGSNPSSRGGKEEERETRKEKGPADSLWRQMEEEEEERRSSLPPHNVVILACDATRDHNEVELRLIVSAIRTRGGILCGGDTLLVLGVLHTVTNPSKIEWDIRQKHALTPLVGRIFGHLKRRSQRRLINMRACFNRVLKCVTMKRINVKITAGTPAKVVILQAVVSNKASWVILDRHLRRDLKFYMKHISCKVALISDNLSIEVPKPFVTNSSSKGILEQKFYSVWKTIQPSSNIQEDNQQENQTNLSSLMYSADYYASVTAQDCSNALKPKSSMISSSPGRSWDYSILASDTTVSSSKQSGTSSKEHRSLFSAKVLAGNNENVFQHDFLEKPILCATCGLRSMFYIKESMKFRFSEIQDATSDFSKENLLGEGGFGLVYKGQLKDGQIIAAKMRKEESTQGYTEFFSEVHVLSFARHRNIVMLLGYCCKEKYNILVYEYICNKSLHWHLFSQPAELLEWHQRYAIAMGIAKGLRFLHEECRGGPIIHRDLRPRNILLTHDFVPMCLEHCMMKSAFKQLGDFGLAKWKSNSDSFQTRVLGTSGYIAPEYAEFGIVSVRTDVYAFGIILFQLISGRRVLDEANGHHQHLLQWVEPLVENLALHELIDPRLGESYDIYELYHLARAAFLCVRRNPEMRPSIGEVVHLLEAGHVRDLAQQFVPHYIK